MGTVGWRDDVPKRNRHPMSQSNFFIPPNVTPPDPPEAKAVALVVSAVLTLILAAFAGFIVVEFAAEMAGYPIGLARNEPAQETSPQIQDSGEELKEPFELITPKNQTQIRGSGVVVIYTERTVPATLPSLWIDGIRHPWDMQYGDNTWFARIQLPAGKHCVQTGQAEAEFFVVMPDSTLHSPEPWKQSHSHLDTDKVDRCIDCHEMPPKPGDLLTAERSKAIGVWKGASGCLASECHGVEKHESDHRFILSPTERSPRCIRCHQIH